MERIDAETGVEITVKRFYMPIKIEVNCPKCEHTMLKNFADDYLSYPVTDKKEKIYFYCQECESESEMDISLKISMEIYTESLKLVTD